MTATAAALAEEGQPDETAWPYSMDQMTPWRPPTVTSPLHKTTMTLGALTFDDVVAALNAGRSVILGLVITDAFYRPDRAGCIGIRTPDLERGGHAVLAVGHGPDTNGETLLLIRNSWGSGWGQGGYAWLPRAYVNRQLHETALLT